MIKVVNDLLSETDYRNWPGSSDLENLITAEVIRMNIFPSSFARNATGQSGNATLEKYGGVSIHLWYIITISGLTYISKMVVPLLTMQSDHSLFSLNFISFFFRFRNIVETVMSFCIYFFFFRFKNIVETVMSFCISLSFGVQYLSKLADREKQTHHARDVALTSI